MDKIVDIAQKIASYEQELNNLPLLPNRNKVSRQEFTLLLSGISTCRMAPGIPVHMGYETLYHCETPEATHNLLEHFERIYGITDKDSLIDFCQREYSSHLQYRQFMTFWADAPMFDIAELEPAGKQRFDLCKSVSEKFYPLLKEKGYYAWDMNETIGLYRKGVACGMLTEEEFWELCDPFVRLAQVFYHSYEEYAISCLCGAIYFMYTCDSDVENFYEINRNLAGHLFSEDGAWRRWEWYVPEEREWADIFDFHPGCIITKAALDSEEIGYMYREEPSDAYPDCGWRFFRGDETEEYVNDSHNSAICSINTICNIDPTITAYFDCAYGRFFGKTENGWIEEFAE